MQRDCVTAGILIHHFMLQGTIHNDEGSIAHPSDPSQVSYIYILDGPMYRCGTWLTRLAE